MFSSNLYGTSFLLRLNNRNPSIAKFIRFSQLLLRDKQAYDVQKFKHLRIVLKTTITGCWRVGLALSQRSKLYISLDKTSVYSIVFKANLFKKFLILHSKCVILKPTCWHTWLFWLHLHSKLSLNI